MMCPRLWSVIVGDIGTCFSTLGFFLQVFLSLDFFLSTQLTIQSSLLIARLRFVKFHLLFLVGPRFIVRIKAFLDIAECTHSKGYWHAYQHNQANGCLAQSFSEHKTMNRLVPTHLSSNT